MLEKGFADLENHWRDSQEQWYFHLPYNLPSARLTETEKKKKPKSTQHGRKRTLSGAMRLLDENCCSRSDLPSWEWLAREAPEASQILKAIAAAVGRMPGLEGMTLLLKTPRVHSLSALHRKIKPD